jgi:hypothetical protein
LEAENSRLLEQQGAPADPSGGEVAQRACEKVIDRLRVNASAGFCVGFDFDTAYHCGTPRGVDTMDRINFSAGSHLTETEKTSHKWCIKDI